MKLFLITQDDNNDYDTYDSAVVAAEIEEVAKAMDPSTGEPAKFGKKYSDWSRTIDRVTVQYLGEAVDGTTQGVICASFNAG